MTSPEGKSGVGMKRERAPEDDPQLAPVPEEMSLPSAAIMRIIRAKLPDGIHINKDAKAAFAKACSIFILYLTVCACDHSKETKRATLTAQDVINALKDLEFDDFVPNIEMCLAAFREADKAKSIESAAKRAARVQVLGADAAVPAEEEEGGEEAGEAGEMEDGDGDGEADIEADVDADVEGADAAEDVAEA